MKVTLNILASDIRETDYLNSRDCAIKRALVRAGFPDYKDAGVGIYNEQRQYIHNDQNYEGLRDKVQMGYYGKKEPVDFSYELELDI